MLFYHLLIINMLIAQALGPVILHEFYYRPLSTRLKAKKYSKKMDRYPVHEMLDVA